MNELLGVGIDDQHQLVFASQTAQEMVQDPTLRDQALNNSRDQFKNAGDVVSIGHQMLVEAKEEITQKNDTQSSAVDEALTRLFGNQEGLSRLMDAMANYIYDYHNRPTA